jgi:hypothetical protein
MTERGRKQGVVGKSTEVLLRSAKPIGIAQIILIHSFDVSQIDCAGEGCAFS